MSKPKNLLGPHPSPKNSTIGPQKFQNDLKKKKSKSQKTKKLTKKISDPKLTSKIVQKG